MHNQARPIFRDSLILDLTEQAVGRIGGDWLEVRDMPELADDMRADMRAELSRSRALSAAVNPLWPRLTPYGLLVELYGSPERLAAACDGVLPPSRPRRPVPRAPARSGRSPTCRCSTSPWR